jgi:predicted phage terminase large subunit-like protein
MARPNQLTPPGDWRIWLILAGRGWGKTRTGAEDIAAYALWHDSVRVGVIAPTFSDARDVCVEGESGLLRLLPPACLKAWHRSTGDLLLHNGSRIKLYSADQPDRLRGPQHHRIWCDELAAWPDRDAFDQLWFGLRLGSDPRVVVTTTPRNTELMRELVTRPDVRVTHGRTLDNAAHLTPQVMQQLTERYAGTRLGRQELDAELLTDQEGALWPYGGFDGWRVATPPPLVRIVVAVDPALSHGPDSDETGLIAAGRGADGLFYVLADESDRLTPDGWAQRTAAMVERHGAQLVVAESNAGGALVERILRQSVPQARFKAVRAVQGKLARALPIAALYEQGRVRHVGLLPRLEEQMGNFSATNIARHSPDRVDALVWALTELSIGRGEVPRIQRL